MYIDLFYFGLFGFLTVPSMDLADAFAVQEKQTRKENILVDNRNSLKKTIKMPKFTAMTTQ